VTKFRRGDRVRVSRTSIKGVRVGDLGTVMEDACVPWVMMDTGRGVCFSDDDLEPESAHVRVRETVRENTGHLLDARTVTPHHTMRNTP
jgi:hypothetical protein